jgi:hypothetical protein
MNNQEEDVFDSISGLTGEYAALLLNALQEGLSAIKEACGSGSYIGSYYDFPSLSFRKNGLPDFSSSISNGPIDYRNCFYSYGGNPKVDEKKLSSFYKLVSFVRANPQLHDRFTVEGAPAVGAGIELSIDEINITSGIKDCINRYIHKHKTSDFQEENGISAITPTLAYIFNRNLDIEICIPILFLAFPFDEYKIADGVYVERISDRLHLARFGVESFNTSAHKLVKSSATHALVLKGWHVPNTRRMWDFNILSQPRAYPLSIIDNFFGALRIATPVHTGYAQVYSVAKGWSAHVKADLPCVEGATLRSYPGFFEDYYWNAEVVPSVSLEQMDLIAALYNDISSAKENSIHLSIKRLNQCLVRDSEEDAVLDATIALEALLSDDGNQEMTHKLSMRIGALSRLDKSSAKTPCQAFSDVKKIYAYRSAIVHGSKNLESKRVIRVDEENVINTHVLAVTYLRMMLKVLLGNPEFRDPKKVDEKLLLGGGVH